ncbi:putative ammonium transporter 1 [Daphnia pulex]|uniref:putative ammonium transporter 1 n=1 Tax=Daphnia pulex TaxID=6669 RepID=UPI001EE098FD|nr:putative ammonium transporter 1 [Daphnia pulex]
MESAVSALVNNVSSLVSNNVSNFNESRVAGRAAAIITANDVASNTFMEFNAALMADFRHVERTLFALQRNLDDFYFVILTVITFAMQCGFAFMEVGLVRTKNTTNILLKSTIDAFVGCLSYWLFGYAIAWSQGNSFVGWNHWAFANLAPEKYSEAFYQMIFTNTAATIVSGAVAERLNLPCYFVYGFLLSGFAYPALSRWGWYDGGWLKLMGFRDFGGSGLVHMFSGTCALVASTIIGPRAGRFDPPREGGPSHGQHIPGHSLPFVGLGALLLIFGFLGFNAASQLSLSKPGDGIIITYATLNTLLGASGGALTALFLNRFLPFWGNYWSYLTMVNGSVAGMAAVCAGCDSLAPWAAVVTGILGGAAFMAGRSMLEKLEVDDPVDGFPIHFCGGLAGLLSAPFLIREGIFFKQDAHSAVGFGCSLLGSVVIICWAVIWCYPIFSILKCLGILRVPLEMELAGMDAAKHNELAYPASAWKEEQHALLDNKILGNNWMPRETKGLSSLSNNLTLRRRDSHVIDSTCPSSCTTPTSEPASLLSVSSLNLGENNAGLDVSVKVSTIKRSTAL